MKTNDQKAISGWNHILGEFDPARQNIIFLYSVLIFGWVKTFVSLNLNGSCFQISGPCILSRSLSLFGQYIFPESGCI